MATIRALLLLACFVTFILIRSYPAIRYKYGKKTETSRSGMATAAALNRHIADVHKPKVDGFSPSKDSKVEWPNDAGFDSGIEQRAPKKLEVIGVIPSWAAGSLVRTGPGTSSVKGDDSKPFAFHHWFDGFALIHKFDLVDRGDGTCEVRYSSRSHADKLIERARANGGLEGITFGQKRDPCDTLFKKFKSTWTTIKRADTPANGDTNINVNLMRDSNGGISVTSDISKRRPFDLETLEPYGVVNQTSLHPELRGPLSAAHPASDSTTGDYFNYNIQFGPKDTYRVFRSNINSAKTELLATFKDAKASYIHSMFLTRNFVILCVWPAFINGMKVLWEANILEAMKFDPQASSTWYVLDRKSPSEGGRGIVAKFKSPAMFSFHTTNAYEETVDDSSVNIFAELFQFDDMDILHHLHYNNLMGDRHLAVNGAQLARYKLASIPLSGNFANHNATAERVVSIRSPNAGDLPLINPNFAQKPHRYVYSVIDRGLSSFVDAIGKTDTGNSTCMTWEQQSHTPGEPVFIPRPGGTEEDDGIILSVVLDGYEKRSYLLCLSAKNMTELGRAEAEHPIPFGFHGMHLGEAEVKQKTSRKE